MFFKKIKEKLSKQNKVLEPKEFILSNDAISFIKNFAMPELNIVLPIDEDKFDDIFDFAEMCELNMMDDDGNDRQEDYPEKERDILGDKFVGEVSGHYGKDHEPDLADLNSRLEKNRISNEILKSRFTPRAKEVAKEVLDELHITEITEDNMYDFQLELDLLVSGLVHEDEVEKKPIDHELLAIYDLLIDIVIDNEDDLPLLNELFLG